MKQKIVRGLLSILVLVPAVPVMFVAAPLKKGAALAIGTWCDRAIDRWVTAL